MQIIIKRIFSFLCSRPHFIFFIATLIAGLLIISPLRDFQGYISQGDHGRDLYGFSRILHGERPYIDFFWPFGPLMAYYYAFFFKIFSPTIQSALAGQNLLILTSGLVIYFTSILFLPARYGFLCALWYWAFRGLEFFYTYNHSGGIFLILIIIYSLIHFIKNDRRPVLLLGFLGTLLLILTRLNMGIAFLISFILSIYLTITIKQKKVQKHEHVFCASASLVVLLLSTLIYWVYTYPLAFYELRQCFPYGKADRTDISMSAGSSLAMTSHFLVTNFFASGPRIVMLLFILAALVYIYKLCTRKKTPHPLKNQMLLSISSLFIFLCASSHEFILSGTLYRMYWVLPIFFLFLFFLLGFIHRTIPNQFLTPPIQICLFITLFSAPFFQAKNDYALIKLAKQSSSPFSINGNNVFTYQTKEWKKTVNQTVSYINRNSSRDETFFALPFDALYYFLTNRKSPVRQLIFFNHNQIHLFQEKKTIQALENNSVNYIVISNRAFSNDSGLGILGVTHCPNLFDYIYENFHEVAKFGDWQHFGGWAWNHGTKIFKRNE